MKIEVAKSAGFCFGVKRATKIALDTLKKQKNVFILGDIVHNKQVIDELRKNGIKRISKLKKFKNATLIIRAHGEPKNIYKKSKELGVKIIDATCPMVKEIHKIALNLQNDKYKIIIIGDKNHEEVIGIAGQLKNRPFVVQNISDIARIKFDENSKIAIITQSTQEIGHVLKIVNVIKSKFKNINFINTICNPTKYKQKEIKLISKSNDLMLVIGSKNSANTKRLFEISKRINPKTYWIESKREIKSDWLTGAKKVGITAGASTPDVTIRETIKHLKRLKNVSII